MYKKISLQLFAVMAAVAIFAAVPIMVKATGYAYSDLFIGGDDFEAYTSGSDPNGYGSTAGWDGPWVTVTSAGYSTFASSSAFVVTATNPLEDHKSLTATWSTTSYGIAIGRPVHSNVDGDTVSFKIKSDNGETAKDVDVIFMGNNGSYWYAGLHAWTGQFCVGGSTSTCFGSFSANTMYTFDVQFDYSNSRARLRVNGGAWSSWVSSYTANSGLSMVDAVLTDGGYGNPITGWWDDFRFSNEPL